MKKKYKGKIPLQDLVTDYVNLTGAELFQDDVNPAIFYIVDSSQFNIFPNPKRGRPRKKLYALPKDYKKIN